jgi:Tol biopolymer transport system component/tRNA A-37 threonylcarbamoyl transferase component Bud32
MGEVYRARDTRLAREVALKVLPDVFAGDAERLARFQREARTLASLNHPHIAQLHGLEDDGTTCALVMELVEGEDLAERVKRGPIPLAEALGIAKQIVEALDAAHDQGIVHRDLKPANIKIRDDGTVKVLDFGLAKALEGRGADSALSRDSVNSPTITTPAMTLQGVILGTAAYMAPEQAKGKVVDRRADIWAFGCVLYEMVTGRRAFAGDDVTDTLAAVLRADVDWTGVPGSVVRLLKKCLEKDPKRRLQDIGDAWDLIDEDRGPALAGTSQRSWIGWGAAGVFLLTTIALGWIHFRETASVPAPVRFYIQPPPQNSFDIYLAVSPDGRRVAFTARDDKGLVSLWVRDLGSLDARKLPGTEGAWSPFWSPDSGSLAFSDGQMLKKIDIAGGPPQTLCEIDGIVGLGTWGRDGVIVFGSRSVGPLRRVPASGGVPAPVTALQGATFHSFPAFLPDGRRFLYFLGASDRERQGIYLGSLDVSAEQQTATRLMPAELGPVQVVSDGSSTRLLYVREQTVMSQPFDLTRSALVGEPEPVIERVGSSGSFAFFGAVPGVLAYRTGSAAVTATGQLTWLDRKGQPLGIIGEANAYSTQGGALALAPDGAQVAVGIAPTLRADIWLIEFEREIRTRFTFLEVTDNFPVWSPDGGRLAFASNREGRNDLYVKEVHGTADETLLHRSSHTKVPTDWSRDGRFLLFVTSVVGALDLWVLNVDNPAAATALLATPFNESDGRFSPDGRWVAYVSNESGRNELYLRPFSVAPDGRPGLGARWQVSAAGGSYPRWRRDGRELFYRAPDGAVVAVDVTVTQGTTRTGRSRPLFTLPPAAVNWDVSPDGQRFLVAAPVTTAPSADPIAVVLNWQGTRP